MNERGKTQPPLAARDVVTRNVNARFVSPLPPASVLSTPNALKGGGTTSSSSFNRPNTARTTSSPKFYNNNENSTGKSKTLLIAAPPGTTPTSLTARPGSGRNGPYHPQNSSAPLPSSAITSSSSSPHQQLLLLNNNNNSNTNSAIVHDPYDDDDNLPDDCPASRRLESAKRKLAQLSNSILAAELASEMRPDLATEIASKDIVARLLKDSNPKIAEIRSLLEEMASKGVENQFEVAFVSNNDYAVPQENNSMNNNKRTPTITINDENYHDDAKLLFSSKGAKNVNEKDFSPDELARSVIKEKMLFISEPPSSSIMMSTSTINRNTQVTSKSGQLVPYNNRRRSSATSSTAGYFPSNNNNKGAKRRTSIASSLFDDDVDERDFDDVDDDDESFDGNDENQGKKRSTSHSSASKTRKRQRKSRAVDLQAEDDISTALAKEGKPMLIESSRGLAGLQRTVGSVVQIFDAVSSTQQRAFQHYIDKWFRMASEILPMVQKNVAPHDFIQIRQFLVNTQKIAADSHEKLTQLSDQMFAKTRDAASNIAVSCAETKDSILKIQQVVHDIKAELALASTLIPQSLYSGPKKEKESATLVSVAVADPSPSLSASPSSQMQHNTNSAPVSAVAVTVAVAAPSPSRLNSQQNLPPPSQLNPYTGMTYVCVAVENLVNLVFPGSGVNTTLDSATALAVPSAMSVLFSHAGAPHFSFSASSATTKMKESPLHSFASGKQAMNLVRSFVSNTVTPSGGHVVALRPFGPFLVAFDSISSAAAWARGVQLYASTIPWPEDVLNNGALFGITNCKKTKVDLKDVTGLERAVSVGTMSAAVLMESQSPPPAVNQMSITEEIFFNAWRSMLGDGGVINGPGGALAHKISRLSLLQMKETFTSLQRGRLYERRGPQFKIGMAFESITNVVSTAKFITSLQRGGGIRTMVATATSLCAAASGGTTIGTSEMANLIANARNNTVLGNVMPPIAVQAEEEGLKLLIAPPPRHVAVNHTHSKKSLNSTTSSFYNNNPAVANTANSNTSASSPSPSKQEKDNNNAAASSSAAAVDALGVTWLPLALLPERHRYTLRQCGNERIFKIDFSLPLIPPHLQEVKKEDQKTTKNSNTGKEIKKSVATGKNPNSNNSNGEDGGSGDGAEDHFEEKEENDAQDFSSYFDPRSEQFDAMWWSRDDVSGGGGSAITRPLQVAYLLPPQPIKPQVCSREQQCDPNMMSSNSRPTSPHPSGTTTTKVLFSPDQTHNNNNTENPSDHLLDEVAAAMQDAITSPQNKDNNNNNNSAARKGSARKIRGSGVASPNATATTKTSLSETATSKRNASNGSTSRRRKRGKEPPVEIEIKIPPVMVERGDQTMIDQNYDFTPLLIDQIARPEGERQQLQLAALAAGEELVSPTELIRSNEGYGGHDSLSDDSAAAVVDMCSLLEKFVLFLSGTIQFKELLAGIAKFVGPLHQFAGETPDNNYLLPNLTVNNDDGDETEDSHVTASRALPGAGKKSGMLKKKTGQNENNNGDIDASWDLLADTLIQHILARLTFPVPPAQTTTFRLLVAGMLSCAAEFVRSVPEEEANTAMEKFKKVFDSSSFTSNNLFGNENNNMSSTTSQGGTVENILASNNNNIDRPESSLSTGQPQLQSPTPTGASSYQQQQQQKLKRVDPTLRILSSVMTIAQQIKLTSLDLADDERATAAAVAAAHASALHQQIRRRSRTNSAVQQTLNSSTGSGILNMNNASQIMMMGSRANASNKF